jgi:AcrR family transcriptional regulator
VPRASKTVVQPRKMPVQARSKSTVSALFEASIQVLLARGYRQFTTTRVAERAGVSVGTLYQYYPNKQALIVAVTAQHLDAVVARVKAACDDARGQELAIVVRCVVDAFLAAKLERADVSTALYEASADVKGAALAKAAALRAGEALAETLRACPDVIFDEPMAPSMMVVTACSAIVQAALEAGPTTLAKANAETLRDHMSTLALAYLRAIGRPRAAARRKPRRSR